MAAKTMTIRLAGNDVLNALFMSCKVEFRKNGRAYGVGEFEGLEIRSEHVIKSQGLRAYNAKHMARTHFTAPQAVLVRVGDYIAELIEKDDKGEISIRRDLNARKWVLRDQMNEFPTA